MNTQTGHKNIPPKNVEGVDLLRWVTDALRGEKGCPWDKKQNLQSLMPYFLEEAYELVDAVLAGSQEEKKEEMGDILFHIFLMGKVSQQSESFALDDIAQAVSEKLIRRHPHVFVSEDDQSTTITGDEALANWEKLKAKEKQKAASLERRSVLSGVPADLPALLKAQRLQEKASRLGFDWQSIAGPAEKIQEELNELLSDLPKFDEEPPYNKEDTDGVRSAVEEELGDLLFSLVNYARFLKISPEIALRKTADKFRRRFMEMEKMAWAEGKDFHGKDAPTLDQLDAYWQRAKALLREQP